MGHHAAWANRSDGCRRRRSKNAQSARRRSWRKSMSRDREARWSWRRPKLPQRRIRSNWRISRLAILGWRIYVRSPAIKRLPGVALSNWLSFCLYGPGNNPFRARRHSPHADLAKARAGQHARRQEIQLVNVDRLLLTHWTLLSFFPCGAGAQIKRWHSEMTGVDGQHLRQRLQSIFLSLPAACTTRAATF